MLRFTVIFSFLLGVNIVANAENETVYSQPYSEGIEMLIEQYTIENQIFNSKEVHSADLSQLKIIEVEDDVELNFNPKAYLPNGFNALKGKNEIKWNQLELVEIDEEIELGIDPQLYLPNGFDPYEGMETIWYELTLGY